jgi:hypothetical protein
MSSDSLGGKWLARCSVIMTGFVFVGVVLLQAIAYAEGRSGGISFLLSIGIGLIVFACLGTLFVLGIIALIRRRQRGRVVGCVACSLLVLLVNAWLPPSESFRMGFRHRLQAAVTPDELRQIAAKCSELLPLDGCLPGPSKNLWKDAEHAGSWKALTNATAIARLDPSLCIYNHSDEVEILWGGALAGHWGVVIRKSPDGRQGDIAPGIRTVCASN